MKLTESRLKRMIRETIEEIIMEVGPPDNATPEQLEKWCKENPGNCDDEPVPPIPSSPEEARKQIAKKRRQQRKTRKPLKNPFDDLDLD